MAERSMQEGFNRDDERRVTSVVRPRRFFAKGGFHFAAAGELPRLMREFGNGSLRNTPPVDFPQNRKLRERSPSCTPSWCSYIRSGRETAAARGCWPS